MILDPKHIRSTMFFKIVFQILIASGNHWPGPSYPEPQEMKDDLARPHSYINSIMIRGMLSQEYFVPHVLFVAEIMRVLLKILIYLFHNLIWYSRRSVCPWTAQQRDKHHECWTASSNIPKSWGKGPGSWRHHSSSFPMQPSEHHADGDHILLCETLISHYVEKLPCLVHLRQRVFL